MEFFSGKKGPSLPETISHKLNPSADSKKVTNYFERKESPQRKRLSDAINTPVGNGVILEEDEEDKKKIDIARCKDITHADDVTDCGLDLFGSCKKAEKERKEKLMNLCIRKREIADMNKDSEEYIELYKEISEEHAKAMAKCKEDETCKTKVALVYDPLMMPKEDKSLEALMDDTDEIMAGLKAGKRKSRRRSKKRTKRRPRSRKRNKTRK